MKLGATDISNIKLGAADVSKVYLGSSVVWMPAANEYASVVAFSGGTQQTVLIDGAYYEVYTFTNTASGSIEFASTGVVDRLLIGGGGGGGTRNGGGGGSGSIIISSAVISAGVYNVVAGTLGTGGNDPAVRGGDGGLSSFAGDTAEGGAGGGSEQHHANTSGVPGSAGGQAYTGSIAPTTTATDGANDGAPGRTFPAGTIYDNFEAARFGGGGGGTASAGQEATGTTQDDAVRAQGGQGVFSDITGSLVEYGKGGRGGCRPQLDPPPVENGRPGLGDGGDGNRHNAGAGADGSTGSVIIRVKI